MQRCASDNFCQRGIFSLQSLTGHHGIPVDTSCLHVDARAELKHIGHHAVSGMRNSEWRNHRLCHRHDVTRGRSQSHKIILLKTLVRDPVPRRFTV